MGCSACWGAGAGAEAEEAAIGTEAMRACDARGEPRRKEAMADEAMAANELLFGSCAVLPGAPAGRARAETGVAGAAEAEVGGGARVVGVMYALFWMGVVLGRREDERMRAILSRGVKTPLLASQMK